MTTVVIRSERGRPKYITDDCSLTPHLGEATTFNERDYDRLNSFMRYLTRQFGDCFTLMEVED